MITVACALRWFPKVTRLAVLGFVLATACTQSHAQVVPSSFTWRAVEIYGNKVASDDLVLDGLPMKLGSASTASKAELNQWCSSAAARLKVESVSCATVFLRRDRAYLVLDIVEADAEPATPIKSTAPIGHSVEPVDSSALKLGTEFQEFSRQRFFAGQDNSVDKSNTEYLDFTDDALKVKAKEIHAIARASSNVIVGAALRSADLSERRRAAYLLNWVGNPGETIQVVHSLMLDSDPEIRNTVTNFVMAFLGQISSPEVLSAIQTELFTQVRMPSHTDRNKALYALQEMTVTMKAGLLVTPEQLKVLEDIIARSHLPNIAGPARYVLQTARERIRLSTK
jgi:hypothetical protein